MYRQRALAGALFLILLISCINPQVGKSPLQPDKLPEKTEENDWTLTYHRSGGLMGLDEQWVFHSDGRMIDSQGNEITSARDDVTNFLSEVETMDLSNYSGAYGKDSQCRDCIILEISVQKDGQSQTISIIDDPAVQIPEAVQGLFGDVSQIIASLDH
jgi:hypothetical protein